MNISIIAAVGKNLELGKANDLIWHFKEDMKFFKQTTIGNTVVMGRKTFESLPKPLADRQNIVITNNKHYTADGAEVVFSLDEALDTCKNENVFIIGGGKIYKEFLPRASKLYLTEIKDTCDDADTYFPEFDKSAYNREVLASYEKFDHVLYTKKK